MKPTPVLILTPSGDVATPAQASDFLPLVKDASLAPLAKDATLAALQAALLAVLPGPNTKITTVTVSLAAAVVDQAVSLGTLAHVETVVVKTLTGATATLKFGPTTEAPIPLAQGEARSNLSVTALFLNSPGGAGGTVTLELQGR